MLEDCISLLIAALYFDYNKWLKKSTRLLINELEEQTLADGAHYEDLKEALEKLQLNDASLSFEPETSLALGFGFLK